MPKYRRAPRLRLNAADGRAFPAGLTRPRLRPVAESADTDTIQRVPVREATVGGAQSAGAGRLRIRLIRAGWSLNGNFYPAEVLRRDGPAAWPAGTQAFADHATDEEDRERPAGSIRNLAGVLTTGAQWDEGEQALFAEVRLFAPWRESIVDMADTIGMSIRAWVTGEHGQAEGRDGFIVGSLPQGRSVDFVTVPAAGGGIVSVLESVGNAVPAAEARNAGHWFEARIHAAFTELADRQFGEGFLNRDERIALSGAVGDALAAFAARLESDAPHLYERDPWEPSAAAPETAAATETATPPAPPPAEEPAAPAHPNVPDGAPPTAPHPSTEEDPAMSGTQTGAPPEQAGTAPVADTPTAAPAAPATPPGDPRVTEALRSITDQLAEVRQALSAATARADERDAENRTLRNTARAREATAAALRAPDLADVATQIGPRVVARVLAAVPTDADGDVDEAALAEAVTAAVTDEARYVRGLRAQALEAAGVGQPYGLGGAAQEEPDDGLDAELAALFGTTLGLSEAAATIAVKGR